MPTTANSVYRERFAVKFYVVGLLFIVFDLETVFFYPWAVQLRALGWTGFFTMFFFAIRQYTPITKSTSVRK